MTVEPQSELGELLENGGSLSDVFEYSKNSMATMHSLCGPVKGLGRVFINVPMNSLSPVNTYLVETLVDARSRLTETGFRVIDQGAFATQGCTVLEPALRNSEPA